ncbi:MAG: hypothetical protein WD716_13520 [Fimbriimonadaceae bacterium]
MTFTHPGAHSSVVLGAFGRQIGETIKPTGSVLRDYFLVLFDKMPVADAKAAIAKGLNATWVESGGVLYLTRTKAQELAEEQELYEAFKKSTEEAIKDEKEREGKRKPYDQRALVDQLMLMPKDEYWDFDFPESPSERLYSRLISSLDPKDLFQMPDGTISFSSRPTGDERPLPKAWRDAYAKFIDDSAVWGDVIDSVFGEEDERRSWFSEYGGRLDETATFEVQKKGRDININMSFEWDGGGSSIGMGGIGYSEESGTGFDEMLKGVEAKVQADADTLSVWKQPEDRSTFFDYGWRSVTEKRAPEDVPALLNRIVRDLEHIEPLSALVSWPFIQLAEAKRENFVVLMPDSLVNWPFSTTITGETSLQEMFEGWWLPLNAKHDTELKCWYLVPGDRPAVRKSRVDRAPFGRLLRAVLARGWLGLNEIAGYTAATGATEVEAGFNEFLSIAASEATRGYYDSTQISIASRIYATVSEAQRSAVWGEGLELPIELWPSRLRQVLLENDWGSSTVFPDTVPDEQLQEAYDNSPTVVQLIKRGLPRGTTVHIVARSEPTVFIQKGEGEYESGLESVGWHILAFEQDPQTNSRIDAFAPSQRDEIRVELRIPGVGTHEMGDAFVYTPFKYEYKPLDKLEPSFRQAIKEAVRKAREGDGFRLRPRL